MVRWSLCGASSYYIICVLIFNQLKPLIYFYNSPKCFYLNVLFYCMPILLLLTHVSPARSHYFDSPLTTCVHTRCIRSRSVRLHLDVQLYVTSNSIVFFTAECSMGLLLSNSLPFFQQCLELVLDLSKTFVRRFLRWPHDDCCMRFCFRKLCNGLWLQRSQDVS